MKRIALFILMLLAAVSCREKYEYNQTLGLLSEYNVLSNSGGSTQVAVFSNTSWTVELDHPVAWASIDRFNGIKSGYLVFDYDVNYGRSRRVILVFKAGDQTRTLNMFQQSFLSDSECEMTLDATTLDVPAAGAAQDIKFSTNLVYNLDEMFLTLSYPEGQEPEAPWITLKGVEKDKVSIEIAPNNTGTERTANLKLSHTDAGVYDSTEGDTIYSNTVKIVQPK
ncbi:MAG: BACON domain-containing protein [Bacteroidales bacterium]|nr:BACON domain-containing protein [Bacteroidales bacterium]